MHLMKQVAAIAAATLVWGAAANAQEIVWRVHNIFPQTRSESKAFDAFAEAVKERSGGKLQLKMFHSGSLGLKDADLLRTLPAGAAEMAMVNPDYISRDAPAMAFLFPNGILSEPAENDKAVGVLTEIERDFFEKRNLKVVGFYRFPTNWISVFCRGQPVQSIAELKSRKLRVWSKDLIDTFKEIGVSAQILPQADLYMAMQTGVLDCSLYPHSFAASISLQEVAKSASFLFIQSAAPMVVITNKKAWDALPKDLQDILASEAKAMFERSAAVASDDSLEKQGQALTTKAGVTLLPPFPPADQRALREAAMLVWEREAKRLGDDAMQNRERVLKALGFVK